jgi:uncharacterized protein YegP (UPF0339 family)
MGTAPKKSRAGGRLARPERDVRVPESMEFLIFEDSGGAYHWRIVAGDGAIRTESGSFASNDRLEQAARRVGDAAASARLKRRGRELGAVDLAARHGRLRDDLDAERWFDESGRFTGEAVARWPDHR